MSDTGVVRFYYDSEGTQVHYECFEVDGKREGDFRLYNQEGLLMVHAYFVNHTLDGDFHEYYENGCLKTMSHYIHGKREGACTNYYDNGRIETIYHYVNDIKIGETRYVYNADGSHYCIEAVEP